MGKSRTPRGRPRRTGQPTREAPPACLCLKCVCFSDSFCSLSRVYLWLHCSLFCGIGPYEDISLSAPLRRCLSIVFNPGSSGVRKAREGAYGGAGGCARLLTSVHGDARVGSRTAISLSHQHLGNPITLLYQSRSTPDGLVRPTISATESGLGWALVEKNVLILLVANWPPHISGGSGSRQPSTRSNARRSRDCPRRPKRGSCWSTVLRHMARVLAA